jgi:hypothetical protein
MAETYRKIRIFVASPSDVQEECRQLARVIDEINLTIDAIAPEKKLILELLSYRTHVHPALGSNPQQVVNEQIRNYDIFVGILWKRMGTPTPVANSGTEEEFRRAYARWQSDKTLPVLVYFCQQPFPPPATREEVDQLAKVVDFRTELSTKGLIADYADHESFSDVIRPHLLLVLGKMFLPAEYASTAAKRAFERTSGADDLEIRQQVLALAQEYDTLRATMESGPSRTRHMEVVTSKMRALALRASSLLADLSASASAGQRLAAVAILQALPNPDYLGWLAARLRIEKPFIGFQSALALLYAVRTLHSSHAEALSKAISEGKRSLETADDNRTDRFQVLEEAERELNHLARDVA